MEKTCIKIAIIGIGNLLMADEGFGVHVIRHLEDNYVFPKEVSLIDCGTAGIYMAPVFEEAKETLIIDAASINGYPPGTLLQMDHREMTGRQIQSSMSPHQLGVLEVLEICRLREKLPSSIEFLLVIPEKVEPGTRLSNTVEPKVKEVAKIIVRRLKDMGLDVKDA